MAPGTRDDVIIIGAARSGTNILRDVLCRLSGFGTWPCDEINYIWRYGNASLPHDELTAADARPEVRSFIRQAFRRMARQTRARFLVEKTCANSLRLEFVNRVVPNARYVVIVRDGRDVVPSAMERWCAPLDPLYLARKARFVPLRDLHRYTARFIQNRISQVLSSEDRLPTWGPRFKGMDELLEARGLAVTCAVQWKRSVERSLTVLERVQADRVYRLRYEDFVENAAQEVIGIAAFLDANVSLAEARRASADVFGKSVGKGRTRLSTKVFAEIGPIVNPTLEKLGYSVA